MILTIWLLGLAVLALLNVIFMKYKLSKLSSEASEISSSHKIIRKMLDDERAKVYKLQQERYKLRKQLLKKGE